jgi:hypothetical protein
MPQIDFGQAFSNPDKNVPSAWPSVQSGQPEFVRDAPREDKLEEFRVGARLGRSEWANLVFVTVTFVGGLFCAFYFFNGAELLRAGMAWPREFLYSRPSIAASSDVNPPGGEAFPVGPGFAASADGGGDPFSRSAGVMSLPSPLTVGRSGAGAGLPSTATAPNASSPLAQLGFPAPGGDALIQAFNRAVSDLARVSNLEARRTVAVIQTAVTIAASVISLPSPSIIGRSGAGAGLPSTATIPNASSPFAQLGFPAPGGDALIQAFNRGVSDLARLNNLRAHRTVAVIQPAVTKVEKHAPSAAKDKVERAGGAVTNAAGQKTAQASTTVGTAQNRANSAVNSANNSAQQMMNNTRSTISNPNPSAGLGPVHLPVSLGGGRR